MVFDLAELDEIILDLKTAYKNVVTGKGYTINTGGTVRAVTRQDGDWLKKELQYWTNERKKLVSGQRGIKTKFGTVWREDQLN